MLPLFAYIDLFARYEIFQVIKAIWPNTLYRENLAKEARVNTDFFVQFVNMLVNDVTFVLDETLSSLAKIHDLTLEVRDEALMAALSDEQKQEKNELLEDNKNKAKSYMQLTTETMEMLILFSESLADSFTMVSPARSSAAGVSSKFDQY